MQCREGVDFTLLVYYRPLKTAGLGLIMDILA